MRMRHFLASFIVGCCSAALGAGASAQSVFGLNFLGEHRFAGSARSHALGLSAFAVPDTTTALAVNAATLSGLPRVTFSVFELLGASTVRSGDVVAHENRFELPTVMLAVPLRSGLVFGLGYRTRFAGKGDFTYERPIESAPTARETYKHRSSLFAAPLVLSWAATDWLSLAGEFQLERGSIDDIVSTTFLAENYAPAQSRRVRSFSGTSWAASTLLRIIPRLYLGASLNSRIDYTVNEDYSYTRARFDSAAAFDFSLPFSYGIGAGAGVSGRWWLTAYFWQRGAPDATGFPQLVGSLEDERLIAFGIERRGSDRGGLFERIPVRLGFYEDRWHLEFPPGTAVTSRFVTFGTGFRLPGGPGALDFSIEIGQIGSLGDNGIDERVVRMGVGMSAGESWSKRKEQR